MFSTNGCNHFINRANPSTIPAKPYRNGYNDFHTPYAIVLNRECGNYFISDSSLDKISKNFCVPCRTNHNDFGKPSANSHNNRYKNYFIDRNSHVLNFGTFAKNTVHNGKNGRKNYVRNSTTFGRNRGENFTIVGIIDRYTFRIFCGSFYQKFFGNYRIFLTNHCNIYGIFLNRF